VTPSQQKLSARLEKLGADETAGMNALQDLGLVSDNCEGYADAGNAGELLAGWLKLAGRIRGAIPSS
jgi:hypothetical protein